MCFVLTITCVNPGVKPVITAAVYEDNMQLAWCGCSAGEGERVSFGKNTVKARNSVESWLGSVESAMVSSLRRLAKQGMASYVEEPRAEWVLQQPAQLVIAVSQVYWYGTVEAALKSGTPVQKLANVHEVRWRLMWLVLDAQMTT